MYPSWSLEGRNRIETYLMRRFRSRVFEIMGEQAGVAVHWCAGLIKEKPLQQVIHVGFLGAEWPPTREKGEQCLQMIANMCNLFTRFTIPWRVASIMFTGWIEPPDHPDAVRFIRVWFWKPELLKVRRWSVDRLLSHLSEKGGLNDSSDPHEVLR